MAVCHPWTWNTVEKEKKQKKTIRSHVTAHRPQQRVATHITFACTKTAAGLLIRLTLQTNSLAAVAADVADVTMQPTTRKSLSHVQTFVANAFTYVRWPKEIVSCVLHSFGGSTEAPASVTLQPCSTKYMDFVFVWDALVQWILISIPSGFGVRVFVFGLFFSRDIGSRFSSNSTTFIGPLCMRLLLHIWSEFHISFLRIGILFCHSKLWWKKSVLRNENAWYLLQTRLQCDKPKLRLLVICVRAFWNRIRSSGALLTKSL